MTVGKVTRSRAERADHVVKSDQGVERLQPFGRKAVEHEVTAGLEERLDPASTLDQGLEATSSGGDHDDLHARRGHGLERIGTGLGSQANPLECRGEPGGSLDHGRHRAELLSIGRRVIEQVDQEPLRHHVGRQRLAHPELAKEQEPGSNRDLGECGMGELIVTLDDRAGPRVGLR